MNSIVFKEILTMLEGLEYFFISGLAVSIYSEGKRLPGDIDIAIAKKDIDIFASRLGTVAQNRRIDKGTFVVEDYGFEINYHGQMVECTSGYPIKRVIDGTFDKLFDRRLKKKYFKNDVYVEPLEELINQKIFMNRDKDKNDVALLKDFVLDRNLFEEICNDKGNAKQVLGVADGIFSMK